MHKQIVTPRSTFPARTNLLFLLGLTFVATIFLAVHFYTSDAYADDQNTIPDKELPPYPDVWYFFPPLQKSPMSFLEAPSGDILIIDSVVFGSPHIYGFRSIFSNRQYGSHTAQNWLDDGFSYIDQLPRRFTTAIGYTVRKGSESSGAKCKNVLDPYIQVNDGNSLKEYRVLYLLPEPVKIAATNCEGAVEYRASVVALNLRFRKLRDDSLLASSRYLVLRFRPNMTTPASIVGKSVFLVERQLNPYSKLNLPYPNDPSRITDQEIWLTYINSIRGNNQ